MSKLFRNKWDYWHLFGPMVLIISLHVQRIISTTPLEMFFVIANLILIALAPYLWEEWDRKKVLYSDARVKTWGWFARNMLTSEGVFDSKDMLLGYAGLFIGTLLGIIFI